MDLPKKMNMPKKNKKLKVGFDLDGVLLYNPARIVRPIISKLKRKKFIHRKELQFYVPQKKWEQRMWQLFHKSSLFVAPGFKYIKQLVKDDKIEAYIITARYNHLKKDFDKWFAKMNRGNIFTKAFLNEKDEQPHEFKERMIKKLNLDVFIEDNWDIVNYLHSEFSMPQSQKKSTNQRKLVDIYWIFNFFDKGIEHPHKFGNLESALNNLKRKLR